MRKTIFQHAFLLFLLAGIIYACMEDEVFSPRTSVPPEVSAAQKWFNSEVPNGWVPWTSAHDENETNTYKPDWRMAVSNEDNEFRTVEVHLVGEEISFFVLPDCGMKYEETGDPIYMDLSTDTRLVIRTNKKTKETDAFIMMVAADVDYVERNKEVAFPVRKLTYLNRDPEFSGMISYHNLEGEFVNGWSFQNDEIHVIYPKGGRQEEEFRSSPYQVCYEFCWWNERCQDVYFNFDYMYTSCVKTLDYCWYADCYWVGGDEDNNGNNNSGNDNPPPGGYGGPNTGGNTNPSTPLSDLAKKIIKNSKLDNKGNQNLNKVLADLLKQCGYQFINNHITGKGYAFSEVSYNPNMTDLAQYNTATKGLIFKDADAVTGTFQEEFVHLYQDAYYTGGSAGKGRGNMEFEAKLMQDILCSLQGTLCPDLGATPANENHYYKWINAMTDYGSKYPSSADLEKKHSDWGNKNYSNFLNDFVNNPSKPQYYNAPVNMSLKPDALLNVGNLSTCF